MLKLKLGKKSNVVQLISSNFTFFFTFSVHLLVKNCLAGYINPGSIFFGSNGSNDFASELVIGALDFFEKKIGLFKIKYYMNTAAYCWFHRY